MVTDPFVLRQFVRRKMAVIWMTADHDTKLLPDKVNLLSEHIKSEEDVW
jgi:hypothetical protein